MCICAAAAIYKCRKVLRGSDLAAMVDGADPVANELMSDGCW